MLGTVRAAAKRRFQTAVMRTVSSQAARTNAELVAEGILTVGRRTTGDPEVITYRLAGVGHVGGHVSIGRYCTFGEEVRILAGGSHRTDWVSTYPFRDAFDLPGKFEDGHPAPTGDTSIGHDVWVGREALVLAGVTIGHGAVIGARSVVTKDVAPYTIVAGNPARVIRARFAPDQVERLLELAWWDWPEAKVLDSLRLLNADGGIDQV